MFALGFILLYIISKILQPELVLKLALWILVLLEINSPAIVNHNAVKVIMEIQLARFVWGRVLQIFMLMKQLMFV